MTVLILGCGYTGLRVKRLLEARGHRVLAPPRSAVESGEGLPDSAGRILHSVPAPCAARLSTLFGSARHVVYLSSTGVYGEARDVDERTPTAPRNAREQARLEEEDAVRAANVHSLILRPAAIYGPGRGVHVSLVEGKHRWWGDGSNTISRVHVNDLAAITVEALLADGLTGAYPVADAEPCTAIEITRFCAGLLGIAVPPAQEGLPTEDTRRSNRRVDGSAIRRLLGVGLLYPSYRTGIPASLGREDVGGREP
jgi:nucleoside-diphosphate-sugar epimerase